MSWCTVRLRRLGRHIKGILRQWDGLDSTRIHNHIQSESHIWWNQWWDTELCTYPVVFVEFSLHVSDRRQIQSQIKVILCRARVDKPWWRSNSVTPKMEQSAGIFYWERIYQWIRLANSQTCLEFICSCFWGQFVVPPSSSSFSSSQYCFQSDLLSGELLPMCCLKRRRRVCWPIWLWETDKRLASYLKVYLKLINKVKNE